MKRGLLLLAAALPLLTVGKAPNTGAISISVSASSARMTTPVAADFLATMVGVDTHFSALGPYDTGTMNGLNIGAAVKTALTASNFRYVRDGSPGTLPAAIGNGVALGLDAANNYDPGNHGGTHNNTFSETASTVAQKISTATNPNGSWIELCGNEQDNDPSIYGGNGTKPEDGVNWPTMLADCVQAEAGWIRANNGAINPRNLPIVGPSLVDVGDESFLATALGSNTSLLDYTNVHLGLASFNPGATSYVSYTLPQAASLAKQISPHFFVTECCGYDQQLEPPVSGAAHGGPIYGRGNSLPASVISSYDIRSILTLQALGASRILFYQFSDAPSDCTFGGTGMISVPLEQSQASKGYESDNPCNSDSYYVYAGDPVQPKANFTAVNNFLGLMADPGSTFTPTPLPIAITTSSANAKTFVAQKRNGHVYVFMWREEAEYDYSIQYYCPIAATVKPPPNIGSPHTGTCTVTSEWAQVSIPGYTETTLHEFQADGSIRNVTANIPARVTLSTGTPFVAEFTPN